MSIVDTLKKVFVFPEGNNPSQAQTSARVFRAKSPQTQAKENRPVIPQGDDPNREFSVKYYNRDSARAGENVWTYKTAEGGIAETTPMKYMDGTPFLKRPENVPVPSELMPANAQGLPTSVEAYYFGPKTADGMVPPIPGLGRHGPAHVPRNVHFTTGSEINEPQLGSRPFKWVVVRDAAPDTW